MSDYLKPLCVPDEILLQGKKIYIWGNDEEASRLFTQLCVFSVKIAGFINDEWRGTTLWHRPVVALEDVNAADSVICISDAKMLQGRGMNGYIICSKPLILNPEFDKKQAVIYGAGRSGMQVLHYLQDINIEVICFIDTDRAKAGSRIENILVKDVTYLGNLPESAYVVEVGYFYKEIDETVSKYIDTKKRFYREKPLEAKYCGIDVNWGNILRMEAILGVEQFSDISSYYLYSAEPELAKIYQGIFALMDIDIVQIGDSLNDTAKKVEDLLYEDNYLILIVGTVENAMRLVQKLKYLGMHEGREYTYLDFASFCGCNLSRNLILDLNLGYTYYMDENYLGFQILGKNNKLDYRIVTLGGSTTDGESFAFKSWVDYLYEKFEGKNVTVFNGGISGYTATQELIKLLRDVLNLRPDMVIVYDGVNDAQENYKHEPYAFSYLKSVFTKSAGSDLKLPTDKFYMNNRESFDIWYDTIEQMYLIARGNGIQFFSFLQPILLNKKETSLTLREKTIIRGKSIADKQYASDAKIYRNLANERRIEETRNYMFDLSDIFDDKDVYIDDCHVFEEGNQIIADKIWEKIKGYIANEKVWSKQTGDSNIR